MSTRNYKSIIRFLSGLTFLIFFCPFFQMCSDKAIKEAPFCKDIIAEPNKYSQKELIKFKKQQEKEEKIRLIKSKKEYTFNAYRLIYVYFIKDSPKDIFNHLHEIDMYGILCFPLFILFSSIGFIFSLKSKFNRTRFLNYINITLIILSIFFFYLKEGLLEDINQIKIGYYLFFLNSIAIIYFCNKELKSTQ